MLTLWGASTYDVIWVGCLQNGPEKMDFHVTCIPDQELLSHSCIINLMVDTEAPVLVMDNYSNLTGTRSNLFLACSQVIAITLWVGHVCYNQNSFQELDNNFNNNVSGKASLIRGGKRTGFICSLVTVIILTIP